MSFNTPGDYIKPALLLGAGIAVGIGVRAGVGELSQSWAWLGSVLPFVNGLTMFGLGVLLAGVLSRLSGRLLFGVIVSIFIIGHAATYLSAYVMQYRALTVSVAKGEHVERAEAARRLDAFLKQETNSTGAWGLLKYQADHLDNRKVTTDIGDLELVESVVVRIALATGVPHSGLVVLFFWYVVAWASTVSGFLVAVYYSD